MFGVEMMDADKVGLKQSCMSGRRSGVNASDIVGSLKNEWVSKKVDSEWMGGML